MLSFRAHIQRLAKSTRGAAVIETAIVLPFLALVVMGTIDVARYGAALLRVQQGLNRGLELATIGGPNTATATIKSEVEAQAGTGSVAVVTQEQTCNGSSATWGSSCSTGEVRKFIKVQVTASFQPTFVMSSVGQLHTLDANGKFNLTETGYVRVQ